MAEWKDGKLTVWTGTQRPFGVRGELTAAFGLPEDRVRVIVPDTGAGYGGKHSGEAAVEAARLAREAGRPVKLVWTREEEFTWAYFRPAGVIEIKAGASKDGTLTAWEFHNYNSGGSGIQNPYTAPNQLVAFHQSHSPLRQGSYRALASTANHFARESHIDELARMIGMDPLAFRLKNLKDERMRAVLEAAAKSFGWGRKPGPDCGVGIAVGVEKGGFIATCAEVSVDRSSGRVQVVRATSAFDCGAVVNPDHLKNQVEGALIMGLGGALFEAIAYDGGKIQNPKFSKYRVPRFRDAPEIEVVLDRPQGRAVGRRRRDPDRRHRAGRRQRHLRRHGRAAALDAHGAQWAEDLRDRPVRLREPRKTRKARNETARPSARAGPILGDSFRAFRVPFNRFERGPAGTRSEMTEYGKEPGFTNAGGTS